MAIKRGAVKKDYSSVKGILVATGIYVAIVIVATALCTTLMHKELLCEQNAGLYAMMILFVASAVGTWSNRERNLPVSLVEGAVYLAVTFLISALLFGIRFQGIIEGGSAVLLGCIFSCLTNVKRRRKTVKRRSKK